MLQVSKSLQEKNLCLHLLRAKRRCLVTRTSCIPRRLRAQPLATSDIFSSHWGPGSSRLIQAESRTNGPVGCRRLKKHWHPCRQPEELPVRFYLASGRKCIRAQCSVTGTVKCQSACESKMQVQEDWPDVANRHPRMTIWTFFFRNPIMRGMQA